MNLTANNRQSWLDTVWHALEHYRCDTIPENDDQWDNICTAMDWITETINAAERISLVEAMEAATDMDEASVNIQHAISTPELRDLIDSLVTLYEPTDDMLSARKYDVTVKVWPECLGEQ